jgi:hypothetical protein
MSPAKVHTDRALFAETREKIDAATLDADVEALGEIRVSMAQYAVHHLIHGGGHAIEAAQLSDLARERAALAVAIRVSLRTNTPVLAEAV